MGLSKSWNGASWLRDLLRSHLPDGSTKPRLGSRFSLRQLLLDDKFSLQGLTHQRVWETTLRQPTWSFSRYEYKTASLAFNQGLFGLQLC